MTALSRRAMLLSSLGFVAAAGSMAIPSWARTPDMAKVDLDAMFPRHLGRWSAVTDATPVLPDETVERSIADAYDGWIARVYRRDDGAAVMLVVAYGSSTSRTLAVHRPETCYAAQGFTVGKSSEQPLPAPYQSIVAREMTAQRDDRIEPVLFWMTVAGRQSSFGIGQNLALLRAAWRGEAPDAFLIRASTIDEAGLPLVRDFVADMLTTASPTTRDRLDAHSQLQHS